MVCEENVTFMIRTTGVENLFVLHNTDYMEHQ